MHEPIEGLIRSYERGEMTRRELVAAISAIAAAIAGAAGAQEKDEPTFRAAGIDHVALRVTDIGRSADWYARHLGLTPSSSSSSSRFLRCGPDFLALFRGPRPGLDHYSYKIPDYSQRSAAEALRGAGLEPLLEGGRTYFLDPDGIKVQVS